VGSKSFVTSFQLAGIPGIVSPTPENALDEIKKLTEDSDVGLVLVSDDITESINDELTARWFLHYQLLVAKKLKSITE
jgi:V/A-type H+-transporting ATPase subunit F